jgi:hypothetical protein
VFWTSLDPTTSAPVLDTAYTDADATTDWEIYGRIKADAGNVASAQFLSVLQGSVQLRWSVCNQNCFVDRNELRRSVGRVQPCNVHAELAGNLDHDDLSGVGGDDPLHLGSDAEHNV